MQTLSLSLAVSVSLCRSFSFDDVVGVVAVGCIWAFVTTDKTQSTNDDRHQFDDMIPTHRCDQIIEILCRRTRSDCWHGCCSCAHTHNIINIAQIVNCVGRKQIYLNANDTRILFIWYANVISLSHCLSLCLYLYVCVAISRAINKTRRIHTHASELSIPSRICMQYKAMPRNFIQMHWLHE